MAQHWAVLGVGGFVVFIVGWALLVKALVYLIRPRMPRGTPTPDLIDTPPAVVNLMAHGFLRAPEAAAATLLDLAARGYVEVDQPGSDPADSTVRVVRDDDTGLTAYERRLMDRVRRPSGVAPLTLADLARRQTTDGQEWAERLEAEVREDAARRGLVRPGATSTAMGMQVVGLMIGMVLVCCAGPAAVHLVVPIEDIPDPVVAPAVLVTMFVAAMLMIVVIFTIPKAVSDERYTDPGRRAARHWAGVAEWLRGHEAFATLPPAAVRVWDRYLGYGVALGAAPAAAATIDLRTGRVDIIRTAHTGQSRLVRVRYPRQGGLRGAPSGVRLVPAAIGGSALLALAWSQRDRLAGGPPWLRYAVGAVVALLLAHSVYRVLRAVVDLLAPARFSGRVVRIVPFGTFGDRQSTALLEGLYDSRYFRWLVRRQGRPVTTSDGTGMVPGYFAVIDDGRSEVVTAWRVRPRLAGELRIGALVDARAQRWSATLVAAEPTTTPPT